MKKINPTEALSPEWVFKQISTGIDLQSAPKETLTRGEQWKVWLDSGERTKLDLIEELSKAPGKPATGERISDIPVPYYSPGHVQLEAHKADERVLLVAGGRRAGKSTWLAANLLPFMFKSWSRVWLIGPDYDLAREEFDYIQRWLEWLNVPIINLSKPMQGSYTLETKWHSKLETMTGKNEEKIEMVSLDAAGITEAGQINKIILDRVRYRVSQKRGPIYMSGTLMAAQAWYVNALKKYKNGDEFHEWKSFSVPSFDNLAAYPGGEQDEEIQSMKRNLPVEEYARGVLAEPVAPAGLVFKEFDENVHVVPIVMNEVDSEKLTQAMHRAYSPFGENNITLFPEAKKDFTGFKVVGWEVPDFVDIDLAIDPGWQGGYAVLACVIYKDIILVLDEIYEKEMYGEDVIQECKNRPWWPRVKRIVIDRGAKQHHEGMSEFEKWKKETGITPQTQFVPIPDGIARYRTFLRNPQNGQPRLFIDPKCDMLRWEHTQYRYADHKDERPIREVPIDMSNHAIKALTYLMIVRCGWADKALGGSTTSKKYVERKGYVTPGYNPWEDSRGW